MLDPLNDEINREYQRFRLEVDLERLRNGELFVTDAGERIAPERIQGLPPVEYQGERE